MRVLEREVTTSKDVESVYNDAVAGNYNGYKAFNKSGKIFFWNDTNKAAVIHKEAFVSLVDVKAVEQVRVAVAVPSESVQVAIPKSYNEGSLTDRIRARINALEEENKKLKEENAQLKASLNNLAGLI